ncbi:STAS domain-containing protein [Stenomitos frigidus]|uniref:Anti-anti-sigma factor n=1 Tax=Stenomitos frigidus ULC18 TaxID=2107698 RepID=A0A2T1EEF6_9CYAN|nr:STAS domain-containing protein [Stenomitos frigidus]PSB31088.1 anti-anti-sigma factor [Stenomitos frigidus ULC18]
MTLIHQRECVRLQPPTHFNSRGGITFQQQVAALEPEKGDTWLIDMAQVEFIDSAGILSLVSALNLAHRQGCRVTVCHLRPAIRLIFEITQLDRAFDIVDGSNVDLSVSIAPEPVAA